MRQWMIDIYKLMLNSNCSMKMNEIAIYRYKCDADKPDSWRASFHVDPDSPQVPITRTIEPEIERMSLAKFLKLKL